VKEVLWIEGGHPLKGTLRVSGSKNATLPLLAATLLTEEACVLEGIPDVQDVRMFLALIEHLGGRVSYDPACGRVCIEAKNVSSQTPPEEVVKRMRASVLTMGSLLARLGVVEVSLPGGCAIGRRPIDQHLKGFEALGAKVALQNGHVRLQASGLTGHGVRFAVPTVTGTENLLMAASLANGVTTIENAALEPEVAELCTALQKMGVDIEGKGTSKITVCGKKRLGGFVHRVCRDRIEAATYLIVSALAGEDVVLEGVPLEHMSAVVDVLGEAGVQIEAEDGRVRTFAGGDLNPCRVRTAPYPGFPTDVQAQLMVLLTKANGASLIEENIFENRLMHAEELRRMGAAIEVESPLARVLGPCKLQGTRVLATDLRASACLVLAGLVAGGETLIEGLHHLDRGYERMEEKLRSVGARVERIKA
jgi:UDP-N-acetylglucosamine 1-carboxyvinyltransferase